MRVVQFLKLLPAVALGGFDLVECCIPEKSKCPTFGVCKLSGARKEAARTSVAVLNDLTLSRVAANGSDLLAWISPLKEGIIVSMDRA